MSKRLTRHDIKEPDQVMNAFGQATKWILDHPSRLKAIGAAIVAVLVLAIAGTSWVRAREANANDALAALLETNRRPVTPATVVGLEPFADQASKDSAVIEQARSLLAAHSHAGVTRAANMLLAQGLARTGKYAEAAELYAAVAGSSPDDTLGAAAAVAGAAARAAAGDETAAIAELKRLASGQNPHVPKGLLLERAAPIAEAAGDTDEVLALYRRVVEEGADDGSKATAERKVTELEAAALQPPVAPESAP